MIYMIFIYVNKDNFLVLLGSKNTFKCQVLTDKLSPCDRIKKDTDVSQRSDTDLSVYQY